MINAQSLPPAKNVELDADVIADFNAAMKHLKAGDCEKGTNLPKNVMQRAPGHTALHINLTMVHQKIGPKADVPPITILYPIDFLPAA